MRMTARNCYSVLAAAALAEAHAAGKPVPVSELSARTGAPQDFLVQVLGALRRAGLVESVRGPAGGFRLAAAPERISVGRVLRAAEGTGGFLCAAESCLRATAGAEAGRADRLLGFVLSEMERSVSRALDTLTLAAVAENARSRRAPPPDFQI